MLERLVEDIFLIRHLKIKAQKKYLDVTKKKNNVSDILNSIRYGIKSILYL